MAWLATLGSFLLPAAKNVIGGVLKTGAEVIGNALLGRGVSEIDKTIRGR